MAVVLQEVRAEAGRGQQSSHGRVGGDAAGRQGIHQVTAVITSCDQLCLVLQKVASEGS